VKRIQIPIDRFLVRFHDLWHNQWLLLTAGDLATGEFNMMTVGWGSLGRMWGMPFAQVVVRPTRHTYGFMESSDTFTLCAFPDEYHETLNLLGTTSGRDGDKLAETRLTPLASTRVAAPGYKEAELTLECRKLYWDDMKPEQFLEPELDKHYPLKDYHRIYYGEILVVWGTEAYCTQSDPGPM
jgi:flavin reductase (DIM6/NTAB) family NADH-FMN oxidoreductase RutF